MHIRLTRKKGCKLTIQSRDCKLRDITRASCAECHAITCCLGDQAIRHQFRQQEHMGHVSYDSRRPRMGLLHRSTLQQLGTSPVKHFFTEQLSKLSIEAYMELCREVGKSFETGTAECNYRSTGKQHAGMIYLGPFVR
jgi:hypothetical protein